MFLRDSNIWSISGSFSWKCVHFPDSSVVEQLWSLLLLCGDSAFWASIQRAGANRRLMWVDPNCNLCPARDARTRSQPRLLLFGSTHVSSGVRPESQAVFRVYTECGSPSWLSSAGSPLLQQPHLPRCPPVFLQPEGWQVLPSEFPWPGQPRAQLWKCEAHPTRTLTPSNACLLRPTPQSLSEPFFCLYPVFIVFCESLSLWVFLHWK